MKESSQWQDVITKDLSRTFPFHAMFCEKDGLGQKDLFDILKAYAEYDTETGYCQVELIVLFFFQLPVVKFKHDF